MRLEQAPFQRRKLALEKQLKEQETKRHLLEEQRELERKVRRTAFENDDVGPWTTSAQDKSSFNWTKKDVSDWASRIGNLSTPDWSTARFEETHEVKKHSHFSRCDIAVHEIVPQVLKKETFPRELVYDKTVVILAAETYQSPSWTTSKMTLANRRSGQVCSLLQWINKQNQTRRSWAIWRLYWQADSGQQNLEWAIPDSSIVLHGAFARANLGGHLWSLMHIWRVFARLYSWNLTTQQVWSVSQLMLQTLWIC